MIQPIQTASNIQIIQPLQNRAVFQSVNIMTAQQLTVLPIQTVQPVRNQTISTNDLGGCSSGSVPVSKISSISTNSHSSSSSSASSSTSPRKSETPVPTVPSLSLARTPSPAKTLSLKSRLTTSPAATPVVNPIKLILRKNQDKSPSLKKKVLTLKLIPLEEKEAILRGSKPLRTPTPKALAKPSFSSSPSDRTSSKVGKEGESGKESKEDEEKAKTGSESASTSAKSDADQNPKIKIEPRTQSISLYSKTSSQSAVKKPTEKSSLTTTRGTIRTAPRKTPTPPNTPGTTPPRPTKSSFSDSKSSFGNRKSTQSWTTKIVDNNSTILRSLPQGTTRRIFTN